MKKLFPALLILLGIASGAAAQTNVTGTITDPQGLPYNLGKIRADLIPTGGPQPCAGTNPCVTFQSGQTAFLSSTGSFQMNLYPNSIITPGGTQWQFTVTEPGVPYEFGTGPQTFIFVATIPNLSTVDISAGLSALAPALTRPLTPGPGTFPRLDQVLDPIFNKTFNLGSTTLGFSNGAFDLSATTSLKLRVSAGCTTSANGQICFDSTNPNWHLWNGADQFLATFPVASPPSAGDLAGYALTGGAYTLTDAGSVNQSSGNTFWLVNMTSPLSGDIPCWDTGGPPFANNCTPGAVDTSVSGSTSTYTISLADQLTTIDHDVAGSASVTVTLPTADTLGLNPGMKFSWSNHSTHADSIVPTTWTINGGATLSVPANTICNDVRVDPFSATNWLSECYPLNGAAPVTTVTASAPIVSSGGATPNISCPTCGTGSGNLSGTLTSGKIPVASGANALSDGAILDDTTHAARDNNGFDVNSLGDFQYWVPNNASPGTTLNKMVCDDGTGKGVICSHTTSTTNDPLGVAVAANGAAPGTTGSTGVCNIGFCTVVMDNSATANHYAQSSTTVDGDLSDVGATVPTNGQSYWHIFVGNAGAGTTAIFRNMTASELNASSISGGNGRATQIEVNGSITKNIFNLNSSTPAPGAGFLATTVAASNSGNTTSAINKVAISGNTSTLASAGTLSGGAGSAVCDDGSHNITSSGCSSGGVTSLTGDGTLFNNSASTGAVTLTKATVNPGMVYLGPATSGSSNLVQKAATFASSGATLAYPATPGTNNLLRVILVDDNGFVNTVTGGGNTWVKAHQQGGFLSTTIWYTCQASGSATTVTPTWPGGTVITLMQIEEYSGNDHTTNSSCLDQLGAVGTAGSVATETATTSGSVGQSTELVTGSCTSLNGGGFLNFTVPPTFSTVISTQTGNTSQLSALLNATTGLSGSQSITCTTPSNSSSGIVAMIETFKLTSTGAAIPTFGLLSSPYLPAHTPSVVYANTNTAQTSAITDTVMATPGAAQLYRFTGTVNCTTTSAAATATLNLKYTDTGNTAQTVSVTDTCTALVTSGVPNLVVALRAKAGTNITYGVTIANTPTYDVDVRLEQMN